MLVVSTVTFCRKVENDGASLTLVDCPRIISESIVDKMEQSYFATGYM